ncbi:hypothetical protein D1007_56899 [Hordeum vulgare]|nr:hypothetical protein D1007_56899 [Hordeum vulgare]
MLSGSGSNGVASGGVWLSCLTVGQTEDLARFGLYMSPSAKLPRLWRISADGYPTLSPPTSREELRRHPGGRYNRIAAPTAPPAAPAAPPATPEVPLPSEQATLHQDGDPADMPELLAALTKSTEEAARAAMEEALDEEQTMAAVQHVVALKEDD